MSPQTQLTILILMMLGLAPLTLVLLGFGGQPRVPDAPYHQCFRLQRGIPLALPCAAFKHEEDI